MITLLRTMIIVVGISVAVIKISRWNSFEQFSYGDHNDCMNIIVMVLEMIVIVIYTVS